MQVDKSNTHEDGAVVEADAVLHGIVVLEVGDRVAVGACGSLLAQLGALVIVVEPVQGPSSVGKWQARSQFMAGKQSFAPDLSQPEDRSLLARLFRYADVILRSSDCEPPALSAMLGAGQGEKQVVCDFTAFGRNGPHAGKSWSDMEVQAMTGMLYTTGPDDGPPLPVSIPVIEYLTACHGAGATLAALRVMRISGVGQSIDMALYDCGVVAMSSFFSPLLAGHDAPPRRLGNLHTLSAPWNAYRAQDGWLLICTGSNVQWQRLCSLMGRDELALDPRFAETAQRVKHVDDVDAAVQAWVGQHSVELCVQALSDASVPTGVIAPIIQYPREKNLSYRNMIGRLTGSTDADVFVPGSPLRMSRTPGRALSHVPTHDAYRSSIEALLETLCKRTAATVTGAAQPPLEGVRVLEIGHYTTAPVSARYMGALGADVIKIEPPSGEASRGWHPAQRDQSIFYTVNNSDKRCITIDLHDSDDRSILRDLLISADVLIENLKPGTLSKFGFSPEEIAELNPELVYCAISGFGVDSLYSHRPAFDTVVQGMSGLMSLITWKGMPYKMGVSYADVMGAVMGVTAIIAALEYRHRSGQGQFIDLSMQDIVAWSTQLAWNDRLTQTDADRAVSTLRSQLRTPADVLACPHTAARELCGVVHDKRGAWPALGVPMRLLGTPPQVRRPGPAVGEHNCSILGRARVTNSKHPNVSLNSDKSQTQQTVYQRMESPMAYKTILTARDGAAFVITLHRLEKRNALSLQMMDEINDAVRDANTDSSVRAVILTGGDRFFSAGADLNEALEVRSVKDGEAFFGRANRLCALLESLDKPVIAAIEGFCITGGLELATACDMRVGAIGSSYAITSSRIGTVAGFGGTQRLPRLVGIDKALDILLSAEPVAAEEAYRIGLITRLVDKGDALAEAKRIVEVYKKRGPVSLAFAKRAVHRGMQMDLYSGVELEYALVTSIYGTKDKEEGISAFLEKRDACFTGE